MESGRGDYCIRRGYLQVLDLWRVPLSKSNPFRMERSSLEKLSEKSVRSILHIFRTRRGTCQFFVLDFPNLGRKAFDQGRETGKASPDLPKCWLFEGLGTTRQCDSRCSRSVGHKICGDSPYDLVERPAPVSHQVLWASGFGCAMHDLRTAARRERLDGSRGNGDMWTTSLTTRLFESYPVRLFVERIK